MKPITVKRVVAKTLKVVAGLAGVIFILVPFTSSGHLAVFLFICLFVAMICGVVVGHLDDDADAGYWPEKPGKGRLF